MLNGNNDRNGQWQERKLLEQYKLLYSIHRKNIEAYNKATVLWATITLVSLFFIFKGDIIQPLSQLLSGILSFIGTGWIVSNTLIWKHLRKFETQLKEIAHQLDLPYIRAATFPAMVGQVVAFAIGIPLVIILFFLAITP
jgi:hypothetical protein